jgi:membrane protease subunit HflC
MRLSEERVAMMLEVRDDLQTDCRNARSQHPGRPYPRTDLTQEVSQQTYERMKAERLAEAELIRARVTKKGQRRRAIADRQVVEFVCGSAARFGNPAR